MPQHDQHDDYGDVDHGDDYQDDGYQDGDTEGRRRPGKVLAFLAVVAVLAGGVAWGAGALIGSLLVQDDAASIRPAATTSADPSSAAGGPVADPAATTTAAAPVGTVTP